MILPKQTPFQFNGRNSVLPLKKKEKQKKEEKFSVTPEKVLTKQKLRYLRDDTLIQTTQRTMLKTASIMLAPS